LLTMSASAAASRLGSRLLINAMVAGSLAMPAMALTSRLGVRGPVIQGRRSVVSVLTVAASIPPRRSATQAPLPLTMSASAAASRLGSRLLINAMVAGSLAMPAMALTSRLGIRAPVIQGRSLHAGFSPRESQGGQGLSGY